MSELERIKALLIEDGFTGLYCEGECACGVDDLAPCGELQIEDGEDYINGCSGGYKFIDPDYPTEWIVKSKNTEPTPDEWKKIRDEYY